jgi:hypothetical protein
MPAPYSGSAYSKLISLDLRVMEWGVKALEDVYKEDSTRQQTSTGSLRLRDGSLDYQDIFTQVSDTIFTEKESPMYSGRVLTRRAMPCR